MAYFLFLIYSMSSIPTTIYRTYYISMRKFTYILFLLFVPLLIVEASNSTTIKDRDARAFFDTPHLGHNPSLKTIKAHLQTRVDFLQHKDSHLQLIHEVESFYGFHYTFQQYYQDLPIYGTEVKISLDKKGQVISVIENSYDVSKVKISTLEKSADLKGITSTFLAKKDIAAQSETKEVLLFPTEEKAVRCMQVTAAGDGNPVITQYLINKDGSSLFERSVDLYCKSGHAAPATSCTHDHAVDYTAFWGQSEASAIEEEARACIMVTGKGNAFMPNPLSSAGVPYGGNYIDNDDENNAALEAELHEVEMQVCLENDNFSLQSKYLTLQDINFPIAKPPVNTKPEFYYDRSQDNFEFVNVYFHINSFQNYIQALDYDLSQLAQSIRIDPLSTTPLGDDNSVFQPNRGNPRILYGPGNIDDAEDAEVVIHEYGHALSYFANGNESLSAEREGLEEGLADYFSTSYSRNLSEYGWEVVFDWDAANLGFERSANSNKRYPDDVNGQKYNDCEVWSSTLMDIWEVLGREKTDLLALASLYQYTSTTNLKAAANVLINTERTVFDGAHFDQIAPSLIARGLLETSIDAGANRVICLGDTIQLGGNNVELLDAEIFWEPSISVIDKDILNPMVNPDRPTWYYLTVQDWNNRLTYTDSVFIDVNYCLNQAPIDAIRIVNTDRFLAGRGNAIIEVPTDTENVSVEIFDAFGHRMKIYQSEGDQRIEIPSDDFGNGVYIVRIKADDAQEVIKIAKSRAWRD